MRFHPHAPGAALALLVLFSCGLASPEPPVAPRAAPDLANGEGEEARAAAHLDLREVRASLLAADAGYAAQAAAGLIPAFTGMLDEDVAFLDPGERLLSGKSAALATLAGDGVSAASTQTWAAVRADVSSDGNEGYTYGFGSVTGPFGAGGATRTLPAKYIAYWRKDGGGVWRAAAYVRTFQQVTAPAPAPPGFETPESKHDRYFPNSDPAALRTVVMDVDRAFAARALVAGVPAAFGEFAAADGAMLSGQPGIVYGPDAIRSTLAANFPANGQILWHPVQGHAAASGDLGFTVGESESHTFFPDGAPRVTYSKYLTVWHRLDRGTWRFEMDGGNARPAS